MEANIDVLEILRGQTSLNLFPTENRMSPRALQAMATDAAHRYPLAEGPGYFYGGVSGLADVYAHCEALARKFFSAEHAFVGGLSGLHTMHWVLTALAERGRMVLTMDPNRGGHYATATICRDYGYPVDFIPFDCERCAIDVDRLGEMARARAPHLIYLDMSTLVRLPNIPEIRAAVGDEVIICLDASQVLALVPAAERRIGPASGLDTCSGSTHKTMPGPQKGLIVTNRRAIAERISARQAFAVSSAHANAVGALAITLEELFCDRVAYGRAIAANAAALSAALARSGFRIPGEAFGYSETHQVWIVPPDDETAILWGRRLLASEIRSTVVTLPATGRPGLRLGVQELTRMGMGVDAMSEVAALFVSCLLRHASIEHVRRDVQALVREYPDIAFRRDRMIPTGGGTPMCAAAREGSVTR